MNRTGTIRWIFALLMLPLAAVAQESEAPDEAEVEQLREDLEQARHEVAEAARELARIQRRLAEQHRDMPSPASAMHVRERVMAGMMRPRLGVLLGTGDEDRGDVVVGLTPGSGAERAGIRRGDRLVSINGEAVDPDDPESFRRPLADIEPGTTVEVVVERGSGTLARGVEVSSPMREMHRLVRHLLEIPDAAAIEREVRVLAPDAHPPVPPRPPQPHLAGLGRQVELIGNHAGLEPYFGTAEGVVVLQVSDDNPLGLAPGDVVLAVDDETVATPVALGRHLLGRDPGEPVMLRIMRRGREEQLEGTVPENARPAGRRLGMHPGHL